MDSRVDLNFSLDRVESDADVDSMDRNFTEAIMAITEAINKAKFRAVCALKLDWLTLITESEKANSIASKLSLAHDNTNKGRSGAMV
jgi:hypothetical protein